METYMIPPSGDNQAELIGVYPYSIFYAYLHICYSDKIESMLDILFYNTCINIL